MGRSADTIISELFCDESDATASGLKVTEKRINLVAVPEITEAHENGGC